MWIAIFRTIGSLFVCLTLKEKKRKGRKRVPVIEFFMKWIQGQTLVEIVYISAG